jgi:hypothetical protein
MQQKNNISHTHSPAFAGIVRDAEITEENRGEKARCLTQKTQRFVEAGNGNIHSKLKWGACNERKKLAYFIHFLTPTNPNALALRYPPCGYFESTFFPSFFSVSIAFCLLPFSAPSVPQVSQANGREKFF